MTHDTVRIRETTDLALAAWLVLRGHVVCSIRRSDTNGNRAAFAFVGDGDLDRDVARSAKELAEFRRLIHQRRALMAEAAEDLARTVA